MADEADLTRRERETLDLLCLGLTNEEIAGRLGVTMDGAKYHVSQIISKLGVHDRYEAASWAERRPGPAAALAPIAVLWNRASGILPLKLSGIAAMASAAMLAATVGVLALIVVLFARTESDPDGAAGAVTQLVATQEGDVSLVGGGLSTSNRTILSVCVASPDGVAVSAADISDVQAALDGGLNDAQSAAYPADGEVVGECPAAAAPLGELVSDQSAREAAVKLRSSDNVSGHRVFVYFVPANTYEATFGSAPYFETAAEYFCEGQVCGEITTALYMPEASSGPVLEEALMEALGLLPVPPDPTPDWELCELGTPDRICEFREEFEKSKP